MKKLISVCGSDVGDDKLSEYAINTAFEVGRLVAKKGGVIVCGGHGGVMEAACKGAKQENGLTVGIMPYENDKVNEYVDIAIPTDIGNARNIFVSRAGDVTIAIGGRWGTLSEIAFRMISGKPLILVKGTGGCVDEIVKGHIMQDIHSSFIVAESAEDAVKKAFDLI